MPSSLLPDANAVLVAQVIKWSKASVLKQRLLTAAILVPLVIWAVLGLSTQTIAWIFALFIVMGAWEWTRLVAYSSPVARYGFMGAVIVALILGGAASSLETVTLMVLLAAGVWWLLGTTMVFRYQGDTGLKSSDKQRGFFVGLLVLIPTWIALTHIHGHFEHGPGLLLFLLFLIWGADSGAYFAGRKWGKRKLAPKVSPGKTIEGVVGGALTSAVIATIGLFVFDVEIVDALWFIPLCVLVIFFSVIGDLFESLFKRRAGVKDSGALLPGHGGMLDRIDSLTSAAPIFALGLTLFGGLK